MGYPEYRDDQVRGPDGRWIPEDQGAGGEMDFRHVRGGTARIRVAPGGASVYEYGGKETKTAGEAFELSPKMREDVRKATGLDRTHGVPLAGGGVVPLTEEEAKRYNEMLARALSKQEIFEKLEEKLQAQIDFNESTENDHLRQAIESASTPVKAGQHIQWAREARERADRAKEHLRDLREKHAQEAAEAARKREEFLRKKSEAAKKWI